MDPIKFGTDGWRAVIAKEFTMENVERVAQAAALYFKKLKHPGAVIVGYDTRFLSESFAARAAEVLCGNGLRVRLSRQAVPTPAVSWNVQQTRAAGAVVITSSHNPAAYNGFKLKSAFGGSALPETTREVESLLDTRPVKRLAADPARRQGLLSLADLDQGYLKRVRRYVNLAAIRAFAQTVVFDPMHGTGRGFLPQAFGAQGSGRCRVLSIRENRDPYFGGVNPEPIAENLEALMRAVRASKVSMGLAVDGDADRIGLVDDRGQYVSSHKVLALLLRHFVRNRKERGPVAKTISGTFLIDRMCRAYGLSLQETPIGFKHLGQLILDQGLMLGGEESGGMGFWRYIPERDGILSALLLLEMTAMERRPLSAILRELSREFGAFHYHRIDRPFPTQKREALLKGLKDSPPARLDGVAVSEIKDFDGVKFILDDGSWLLIRPSGTEPVVRIYSESPQRERVSRLLDLGEKLAFRHAR